MFSREIKLGFVGRAQPSIDFKRTVFGFDFDKLKSWVESLPQSLVKFGSNSSRLIHFMVNFSFTIFTQFCS